MAAYDLNTPTPGMVQIPAGMNQGAQNLMQFMRMQREQRNQQDRLALDKTAESNRNQDSIADNVRADDNLEWLKGTKQREREAVIARNQGITDSLGTAKTSLASDFSVGEENLANLYKDPRFAAMAPEEQSAFIEQQQGVFRQQQAQNIGPEYLFNNMVKHLTKSGATFEESQKIAQDEVTRLFPDDDALKLQAIIASGGRGRGSSSSTPLDDTGNLQSQQTFFNKRLEDLEIPNSDGWVDFGGEDLTKTKLKNFSDDLLKKAGLPPVIALSAIEGFFNDDALIDNGSTLEGIISADMGGLSPQEFAKVQLPETADPNQRMLQKVLSTGISLQNQQQSGKNQQAVNAQTMVDTLSAYQTPKQKASNRRLQLMLAALPKEVQQDINDKVEKEAAASGGKDTPTLDNLTEVATDKNVSDSPEDVVKALDKKSSSGDSLWDTLKNINSGRSDRREGPGILEQISNKNKNITASQNPLNTPQAEELNQLVQKAMSNVKHPQDAQGIQAVNLAKTNLANFLTAQAKSNKVVPERDFSEMDLRVQGLLEKFTPEQVVQNYDSLGLLPNMRNQLLASLEKVKTYNQKG